MRPARPGIFGPSRRSSKSHLGPIQEAGDDTKLARDDYQPQQEGAPARAWQGCEDYASDRDRDSADDVENLPKIESTLAASLAAASLTATVTVSEAMARLTRLELPPILSRPFDHAARLSPNVARFTMEAKEAIVASFAACSTTRLRTCAKGIIALGKTLFRNGKQVWLPSHDPGVKLRLAVEVTLPRGAVPRHPLVDDQLEERLPASFNVARDAGPPTRVKNEVKTLSKEISPPSSVLRPETASKRAS